MGIEPDFPLRPALVHSYLAPAAERPPCSAGSPPPSPLRLMPRSLAHRLYHLSPAGLVESVRRRLNPDPMKLEWRRVTAGPLAGHELFVAAGREGVAREMIEGRFDAAIYEVLPKLVDLRDAECWDVGAHIGYHSLTLAALGARVTAFEPNPTNRERIEAHLKRNAALAPRIQLSPIALSDADGASAFFVSDNVESGESSGSHLAASTRPLPDATYRQYGKIEVTTRRADALLAEGALTAPRFMKIDVEGAEALVLRGAAHCLETIRPTLIIEVHHIHLMLEVAVLLTQKRYAIRVLAPETSWASRCMVVATPETSQPVLQSSSTPTGQ
jgi:FkbM family methyltransferase